MELLFLTYCLLGVACYFLLLMLSSNGNFLLLVGCYLFAIAKSCGAMSYTGHCKHFITQILFIGRRLLLVNLFTPCKQTMALYTYANLTSLSLYSN